MNGKSVKWRRGGGEGRSPKRISLRGPIYIASSDADSSGGERLACSLDLIRVLLVALLCRNRQLSLPVSTMWQ